METHLHLSTSGVAVFLFVTIMIDTYWSSKQLASSACLRLCHTITAVRRRQTPPQQGRAQVPWCVAPVPIMNQRFTRAHRFFTGLAVPHAHSDTGCVVPVILTKITGTCSLLLVGQDEQANQSPTNSRQHVPVILTKITGTCCLLLVGQDEQANQSPTNSREHVPVILTKISGTCSLLLVGRLETYGRHHCDAASRIWGRFLLHVYCYFWIVQH